MERMKLRLAMSAVAAALAAATALAIGAGEARLRIYLPETLTADGESLTLGAITLIMGDEGPTMTKAKAVAMGRSPQLNEQITIDRRTILSRLAAEGIGGDRVELSGAEHVIVTREAKVYPAATLEAAAADYLQKHRPGPAGCVYQPAKPLKDLIVPRPRRRTRRSGWIWRCWRGAPNWARRPWNTG